MMQKITETDIKGVALNDAALEFLHAYMEITGDNVPPKLYSNIKPMLKKAIAEYINLSAGKEGKS